LKEFQCAENKSKMDILHPVDPSWRQFNPIFLEYVCKFFSPEFLQQPCDSFRDNAELMLILIKRTSSEENIVQYASERLRDDYYFIEEVINLNHTVLRSASWRIRDDDQIVRQAIVQDSNAFEYASMRLRDDPEIVELAMLNEREYNFQSASSRLRNDRNFVMQMIASNYHIYMYLPHDLKEDRELLLYYFQSAKDNVTVTETLWKSLPLRFRDDPDFLLDLLISNVQMMNLFDKYRHWFSPVILQFLMMIKEEIQNSSSVLVPTILQSWKRNLETV